MSKRSARGGSRQQELLAAEPEQQPELNAADLQLSSSDDEEYESGDSELVSGSDGEQEAGGGEAEVDREIENAVLGYMAAAEKRRQQRQSGSGGSARCGKSGSLVSPTSAFPLAAASALRATAD